MGPRGGGKAYIPVAIAYIDEDIGRGRGDMRTPLNLGALERQGLVVSPDDGAWALTSQGVARIAEHSPPSRKCARLGVAIWGE